jgi:predicted SnoaL-like aldol condensation-catalyzing enzyme
MNLLKNKENAISFNKMAFEGNPEKALEPYTGDSYIQHNPDAADGLSGFIAYFERMQTEYPEKSIEFERCIAEGDLVALHTHQIWPDNDQYVTIDFFFGLTKMLRSVNIGTLYNRFRGNPQTKIRCIE